MGSLREVARQELLELLDSLAGSKALVWDPGLTGPMGLVAEYSLLKEHGVAKMFSLAPGPLPPTNAEHVIFLTRPTLENMDTIAGNIKAEEMRGGSGVRQELHLVFTPRTSLLCEQRLVQVGAELQSFYRELSLPWLAVLAVMADVIVILVLGPWADCGQ